MLENIVLQFDQRAEQTFDQLPRKTSTDGLVLGMLCPLIPMGLIRCTRVVPSQGKNARDVAYLRAANRSLAERQLCHADERRLEADRRIGLRRSPTRHSHFDQWPDSTRSPNVQSTEPGKPSRRRLPQQVIGGSEIPQYFTHRLQTSPFASGPFAMDLANGNIIDASLSE
jgi:hypothetical protein